jgi:hypothetical protein
MRALSAYKGVIAMNKFNVLSLSILLPVCGSFANAATYVGTPEIDHSKFSGRVAAPLYNSEHEKDVEKEFGHLIENKETSASSSGVRSATRESDLSFDLGYKADIIVGNLWRGEPITISEIESILDILEITNKSKGHTARDLTLLTEVQALLIENTYERKQDEKKRSNIIDFIKKLSDLEKNYDPQTVESALNHIISKYI